MLLYNPEIELPSSQFVVEIQDGVTRQEMHVLATTLLGAVQIAQYHSKKPSATFVAVAAKQKPYQPTRHWWKEDFYWVFVYAGIPLTHRMVRAEIGQYVRWKCPKTKQKLVGKIIEFSALELLVERGKEKIWIKKRWTTKLVQQP